MNSDEYIVRERPSRVPTHPGVILKEDVLPSLGLTTSQAAEELGVTRQTLYRIMNGTHSITPIMALRLSHLCGTNPMMWLRLQQAYDLKKAELEYKDELNKITIHHVVFQ